MSMMSFTYLRRVKTLRTGLAVASWVALIAGLVLTQVV
jgi:hypothetical protein